MKKLFGKPVYRLNDATVDNVSRTGDELILDSYYSGGIFTKLLLWMKMKPIYRPCLKIDIKNKRLMILRKHFFWDNSIVWPIEKVEIIKEDGRSLTITHIDSKVSKTIKSIVKRDDFFSKIEKIKTS